MSAGPTCQVANVSEQSFYDSPHSPNRYSNKNKSFKRLFRLFCDIIFSVVHLILFLLDIALIFQLHVAEAHFKFCFIPAGQNKYSYKAYVKCFPKGTYISVLFFFQMLKHVNLIGEMSLNILQKFQKLI